MMALYKKAEDLQCIWLLYFSVIVWIGGGAAVVYLGGDYVSWFIGVAVMMQFAWMFALFLLDGPPPPQKPALPPILTKTYFYFLSLLFWPVTLALLLVIFASRLA